MQAYADTPSDAYSIDNEARVFTSTTFRRTLRSLNRAEWQSVSSMTLFVCALHVLGWGVLLWVTAHQPASAASHAFGVGLGVTAYMLGMRHAFDADHIAAIDNTTRKLMGGPQRPLSVGFWFSLGHSTVVLVLVVTIAAGVKAVAGQLSDKSSELQVVTGILGTLVSGAFLCLIGLINLVALIAIIKVFRRMRHGTYDEATLEQHLDNRGLLNKILRPVTKTVTKPWHMYPVGLLFGLGFDTATEIGLLALAGGTAAYHLPWYAIITLPVLFAAGMSLLDTIDGCFMNVAYGWALSKPVRKVFYNITITALSVAAALLIGTVELASVLAARLDTDTGVLGALARVDLSHVGYAIVVLFVATWVIAGVVWKAGRIEERWTSHE